MPGAWSVRSATHADADAIANVHVDAWHGAYGSLLPDAVLAAQTVGRRSAFWRAALAEPGDAQVWVTGDAERAVLGFAAAGPSRDEDAPADTGELYSLYVDPACWSGGIGTLAT